MEKLLSSIYGLVAYLDCDCNFIKVNKAYAEADGHEPSFFIGKNHFELYPHAENEAIFRRVIKSGEPYPGSRYFCGSLFWASKPKQAANT
ncbi:hypothetical protein BOW53_12100 [Solemya pervernicosa gill symbiont]|uniref:PAS fold-4 domain-containing protein n=1 Tax=Solemya pervernicosa gill symbiont TaxID=642797 RepID=A0A1T2L2G3_9GAMM|nr:hypothetical protein BOW53_12100 [Solemya pervernicosa gill symbiont]